MSKRPLDKITRLVIAESFIQVNFVQGYKYIDKAGEIVNYFHDSKKAPPAFTMGLNGLHIRNPIPSIQEIKISANAFWAHSVSPDSLEVVENFFTKKTQDIIEIMDVEEVSRIGWRNYFVYECQDEDEREKIIAKFVPISDFKFAESVYTGTCKSFSLNIRISKIEREAETPIPSLLIDIDIYKSYENFLSSSEISLAYLKSKETIRSDEFLKMINQILE